MAFGLGLIFGGLIGAIITLIFGVLVLVFPKLLRFVIGIYFILMGILGIIAAI